MNWSFWIGVRRLSAAVVNLFVVDRPVSLIDVIVCPESQVHFVFVEESFKAWLSFVAHSELSEECGELVKRC